MVNPLWQRIQTQGLSTVAVMGMSKNTGKTVALNHLLAQAHAANTLVGVTSIGRDGEERDQVYQIPKPPVRVWPRSLVATARGTLARARARTKLMAGTGIESPMGEIVLVQVQEPGEMEIAGASRSSDQRNVIARLQQCGVSLVLLDGALGRSQHASPAIADGVLLATGAALGGGIQDVLRKTRDRLAILSIMQADPALRQRCALLFEQGGVALWDRHDQLLFSAPIATLNAGETLLHYADFDVATVALTGAVGRSLCAVLKTLAGKHPDLNIVVADGTKLFVDASELAALQRLGARVQAFSAIRLMGITLNPFSPFGGSFDAADFLHAARSAFAGTTICDVVFEEQSACPTLHQGVTA
jgi:hypothetical protein